jgi:hypothetical protein
MSESKTPRTDEFLESLSAIPYDGKDYDRLEAFSRQLETELNEAKAKLADLERQTTEGELVPFEAIQYWVAFEHGLRAPVHALHKPDLNNPKTGMPWRFKEVYQLWREEQCAKERKY